MILSGILSNQAVVLGSEIFETVQETQVSDDVNIIKAGIRTGASYNALLDAVTGFEVTPTNNNGGKAYSGASVSDHLAGNERRDRNEVLWRAGKDQASKEINGLISKRNQLFNTLSPEAKTAALIPLEQQIMGFLAQFDQDLDGKFKAHSDSNPTTFYQGTIYPVLGYSDPADPSAIEHEINQGRVRAISFGKNVAGHDIVMTKDTINDIEAFYPKYCEIDANGVPQADRPFETGTKGRGLLGLWGENPAADPIVFRIYQGKLQVLLIKRNEAPNYPFALPGGMIEAKDVRMSGAMLASIRELKEESGLDIASSPDVFKANTLEIGTVYQGPVDDWRNTNNAWMGTTAFAWILKPHASSVISQAEDAHEVVGKARFHDVTPEMLKNDAGLFASHAQFIRVAVKKVLEWAGQ
jgi:ADP-ribose pyrophosphatase YjhB (NUDIX family)